MVMGIVFAGLSVAIAWVAFDLGGVGYVLTWPAGSALLVALAYLGAGPAVLGKRPDGTIAATRGIPLLPYFILTWLIWHLIRVFRRARPWNHLTDGIVIGRRLLPSEKLPSEVTVVADLTSEFREPIGIRRGRSYLSLPILDRSVPSVPELLGFIRKIQSADGVVYIHCAEGHGRTGTVSALLLAALGVAKTPDEALKLIVDVRPGVRLSRAQRRFVRRAWEQAVEFPGNGG